MIQGHRDHTSIHTEFAIVCFKGSESKGNSNYLQRTQKANHSPRLFVFFDGVFLWFYVYLQVWKKKGVRDKTCKTTWSHPISKKPNHCLNSEHLFDPPTEWSPKMPKVKHHIFPVRPSEFFGHWSAFQQNHKYVQIIFHEWFVNHSRIHQSSWIPLNSSQVAVFATGTRIVRRKSYNAMEATCRVHHH